MKLPSRLPVFIFALCFLLSAAVSLRAAALDFPKGEPAFSITFPETWKTSFTAKDRLTAQPKNGANIHCVLMPVENINDESKARAAVPTVAESAAAKDGIDFASLTVSEPLKELDTDNGITIYAQEWRGKNRKGEEVVLTVGLFAADMDDYYSIVFVASPEADKATEADQAAIVESISVEDE